MATPGTRIAVRHSGDIDTDWLLEHERREDERREALEARIAATDPALVAMATAAVNRRGRRR